MDGGDLDANTGPRAVENAGPDAAPNVARTIGENDVAPSCGSNETIGATDNEANGVSPVSTGPNAGAGPNAAKNVLLNMHGKVADMEVLHGVRRGPPGGGALNSAPTR